MRSTIPATPATLASTTRHLRRALHDGDPARPPSLARLRDTGWQLTQLTGELTGLIALLADQTGHHLQHAGRISQADGEPAGEQLARACRELAALRRALDAAHTAARGYYTTLSRLNPTDRHD